MLKDTKSLGNNKAPACESRGFVHKKKKECILTHLLALFGCMNILFYIFLSLNNKRIYGNFKRDDGRTGFAAYF